MTVIAPEDYPIYPSVDYSYRFHPLVRQAMADSPEIAKAIDDVASTAAAEYLSTNPSVIQSAVDMAANNSGLLPKWKANTAYTTGQQVAAPAPSNDILTRTSTGTTGATFSMTGWTASASAIMLAAATSAPTASTLALRNSAGRIQVADPGTDVTAATPKSYVDAKFEALPPNPASPVTYLPNNAKLDTAAPSTYPLGITYFSTTANGFAVNFGTVVTFRTGIASRSTQEVIQSTSGSRLYRSEGAGDAWGPWVKTPSDALATSLASGLMVNTDKAKLDAATPSATANTLVSRDATGLFTVATPTAGGNPTTKTYVDGLIRSQQITVKTEADGPSLYPLGVSWFSIISADAWNGGMLGTVTTVKNNAGRSYQTIAEKASSTLWLRTETDGDAWNTWKRQANSDVATSSTSGLMSAADKTKSDAATALNTVSTVMMRNSGGDTAVRRITIVDQPTAVDQATRKDYVDTKVAKGEIFKNVRDYRLTTDTTDSGAITRAHAANKVVMYADGKNHDTGFYQNLYGSGYQNALGPRLMGGKSGSPLVDAEPIMWIQKYSNSNRSVNAGEWDQGGLYVALHKEGGDSYGAGLTGYGRHGSAEGGQLIGVHGRALATLPQSEVWGGWSYVSSVTGTTYASLIGHEINVNSKTPDMGWLQDPVVGQARGMVIVTADGSLPISHGLYIGNNSAAPEGKMHSLIHLKGEGVVPSDAAISSTSVANNEQIRLDGAVVANASTGMRFRGGRFRTGIAMPEASFDNNAAILLGDNHRIAVGLGPGSSTGLSFNKTTSSANFVGMNIFMEGTKVLGIKKTGWGIPTGSVSRAAFDTGTVTLPTLAQIVAALLTDLGAGSTGSTGFHGIIGA